MSPYRHVWFRVAWILLKLLLGDYHISRRERFLSQFGWCFSMEIFMVFFPRVPHDYWCREQREKQTTKRRKKMRIENEMVWHNLCKIDYKSVG